MAKGGTGRTSRKVVAALVVCALLALLVMASCRREAKITAPPHAQDRIPVDDVPSLITVPVRADLGSLVARLEREIPKTLWTVDKPDQVCVPSRKVDLGIAKVKTPKLKCRIVGSVTRGPLRLDGNGRDLAIAMPLHAVLRGEDIGGILKRETATADAMAHARVTLDLKRDWSLTGKVDISYDWTNEPHVDFLGQRIDLTETAKEKLAPVISRLERTLPGELDALHTRSIIAQMWRSGFTTLELNERNPPVWMQVRPVQLQYGGYSVEGHSLLLKLGIKAITRTKVGTRPPEPSPTPLPPLAPLSGDLGELSFHIPVVADYRELEPVLMKALRKRSVRPFQVPGYGPVIARFRSARIYGTTGGRIAVGLDFTANDPHGTLADSKGRIWMTAVPVNAPNSRKVEFRQLAVSGDTDAVAGDLALALVNAPALSATLEDALGQNFQKDFDKLLGKVARAIDTRREGDLVIRAEVTATQTGRIRATGEGLYLPVRAQGTASINVTR